MAALDEILATIRRLPLPERLQLIERATLEAAEDTPSAPAVSTRTRTLTVDEFLAVRQILRGHEEPHHSSTAGAQ